MFGWMHSCGVTVKIARYFPVDNVEDDKDDAVKAV
jgi:hypothetical protein